ncbi:MAG: leucine-rich repeat protein [Bacteroidales bacterium]|nr:leucine-rich repeat protein [Bacteroidales bacterium]
MTFTAEAASSMEDPETKTQLDPSSGGTKVLWSVGDQISIFYGASNVNNCFTSDNDAPASSATFNGEISAFTGSNDDGSALYFWSTYPYSESNSCDGESITVTLPSSSIGTPDDVSRGSLITVARSMGLKLSFKNVCSGLRLSFTNPGITRVTVRSNNGEAIAGRFSVGYDSSNNPYIKELIETTDFVELDLSENPSEPGHYYFIPMIPGSLAGGLTIEMYTATQKGTWVRTAATNFNMGKWLPANNKDIATETTWEDLVTIPQDEIWYTTVDGTVTAPSYNAEGYEIVSNTYDADLGHGIIKFNQALTTVTGFSNNTDLTSITLPASVEILLNCFSGCNNLTTITIPNDLIPFGTNAVLNGASALETIKIWDTGNESRGIRLSSDKKALLLEKETGTYLVGLAPSGMTSYEIPSEVTHIASSVFANLGLIQSVSFGSNLKEIGASAFMNSGISGELDLSNVTVMSQAFASTYIQSVTLGENVEAGAFMDCPNLKYIGGAYASSDNRCYIKDGNLMVFASARLTDYTLPSTVTAIGHYAFMYESNLQSLIVDANCTSLGGYAFAGSQLSKVYFNSAVPPTITYSSYDPFRSTSFTIYVPSGSVAAYKSAWADYADRIQAAPENYIIYTTTDGSTITPSETTGFGSNFVNSTYTSGEGRLIFDGPVTSIPNSAFNEIGKLESITFPKGVSISSFAIIECPDLKSIKISSSTAPSNYIIAARCPKMESFTVFADDIDNGYYVSADGKSLFRSVGDQLILVGFAPSGVTSYAIPNGVTSLAEYVFQGCTSLTSVTFPSSLTSISTAAFNGCTGLTGSLDLSNMTSIGQIAFAGTNFSSITLGESTSVYYRAFIACNNLENIYGPLATADHKCWITSDGLLKIFAPKGVSSYTLPSSVKKIEHGVFDSTTDIKSLTINAECEQIGAWCFQFSSLEKIFIKPTTPPTLYKDAFWGTTFPIYVPDASVDAYKAATKWSDWADRIFPESSAE